MGHWHPSAENTSAEHTSLWIEEAHQLLINLGPRVPPLGVCNILHLCANRYHGHLAILHTDVIAAYTRHGKATVIVVVLSYVPRVLTPSTVSGHHHGQQSRLLDQNTEGKGAVLADTEPLFLNPTWGDVTITLESASFLLP